MINECYNTFVELSTQQCLKKDYKDYSSYKNVGYGNFAEKFSLLSEKDKSYLNEFDQYY